MAAPSSLRVQTLSGGWETVGVERYPGLFPEGVRPTADLAGSAAFSFTLQRNPDLPQLDLLAWTPAEFEVAGKVVWEGRIRETPGMHGTGENIAVQAEGWQAHFDDDSLERTWLHQDLTAWVDLRSVAGSNLTRNIAAPTVSTAAGSIAISIPAGTVLPSGGATGISLDLGELAGVATTCVIDATITGANAACAYYIRSAPIPDWLLSPNVDAPGSSTAISNGTFTNLGGAFPSTGYRYLQVFLYFGGGFTVGAADIAFQISRILTCGSNANAIQVGSTGTPATSGIASPGLRASDVILDTAAAILPLLTATARSPAVKDETLADQPQSYWRLGQSTPPAAVTISSGWAASADLGIANNPLNFIGYGAGVSDVAGLLVDDTDGALSFDGVTGRASAPNPSFYADPVASFVCVFSPANPGSGVRQTIWDWSARAALAINTAGHLEVTLVTTGTTLIADANALTLVANAVYHAVVTYSTGVATLTINGAVQPLTVVSGSATGALHTANGVIFGADGTPNFFFAGILDEVETYAYALSASQIANHYQAARARLYGGVQRSQYKIPSYAPQGARTFREHAAAVNALHGWRLKALLGRTVMFQPQPATSLLRAASTVEFTEAAANTGSAVYNRCVVEGSDITGAPVRATVTSAQAAGDTSGTAVGVPQLQDPGIEVSVAAWTVDQVTALATFTRQATTPVHSGSGSGKFTFPSGSAFPGARAYQTLAGNAFIRGLTYTLSFWTYSDSTATTVGLTVTFGTATDNAKASYRAPNATSFPTFLPGATIFPANAWTFGTVSWTPATTVPASAVLAQFLAATPGTPAFVFGLYIDDIAIVQNTGSLLDRRGFTRTKILAANNAIDKVTATALASAFLRNNSTLPFRGSFTAAKPDDVLIQPGDIPVHPSELLGHTNELIRLPLIDPDTGDLGRDGKIALVTYDETTEIANVTIDDDRTSFDALLARMAITASSRGV